MASRLGAMVTVYPEEAKIEIIKKFNESKANLQLCAAALDCSYVTLWRHIRALGIEGQIEKIRLKARREGWIHNPFPPGSRSAQRRGKSSGKARTGVVRKAIE